MIIRLTIRDLARHVWGTIDLRSIVPDRGVSFDPDRTRWEYTGTGIAVRMATGAEIVEVDLHTGRVADTDGGWLADRVGTLGARQRRKLRDALGAGEP